MSIRTLLPLVSLVLSSSLASPLTVYRTDTNPYARLFQRDDPIPPVGSDAWAALYPQDPGTPNATLTPQSWLDALDQAVAAGLIPNISVSTVDSDGFTIYPDGNGTDPDICSFTFQCNATTDLTNPPDGILALSFDDGPLPSSDVLYSYLASYQQHATHFMIGINILQNPDQFLHAFVTNADHIAVHTWSHPYLTTKTNEELVAELGWTVQIIHDSTGGLVPSVYRPPYGDTDMRVRAVAQHVFGLQTVTWNQDSNDWAIGDGTTLDVVEGSLEGWVTGGKSPGLLMLEHELTNDTVNAFMDVYPTMLSSNWTIKPVPDAFNVPWYANAVNSTTPPSFSLGIASPLPSSTPISSTSTSVQSASSFSSASNSASAKVSASTGASTSGAAALAPGRMWALALVLLLFRACVSLSS